MLGVKAKPAKAGRFASPDPCARIVPSSTMSFADRPGLPAGHVSKAHGKATRYRRGQFWTPIRGHFSAPIDTAATATELSTYGGDLATGSGLSASSGTAQWQVANLIASHYGLSSTVSSSMVQTFYQNAFGAAPSASDLSGWTGAANSGHLNTADLIMSLADISQYFLYHHS